MAFLSNVKSWCSLSLFLFVIVGLNEFSTACDCPGAQVSVSGQNFCFEIQRASSNSTWSNADEICLSLGGFLAHIDSSDLINNLKSYVQSNYQRPLLTGGLLGNAEYQLIALMCPNNTFMSLLNTSIASGIINGNASASGGSCLFLETSDYKLHYDNCNITFDILCQIPMDNTQTCGVMMQCANSSSTTSTMSTTQSSFISFTTNSRQTNRNTGSTSLTTTTNLNPDSNILTSSTNTNPTNRQTNRNTVSTAKTTTTNTNPDSNILTSSTNTMLTNRNTGPTTKMSSNSNKNNNSSTTLSPAVLFASDYDSGDSNQSTTSNLNSNQATTQSLNLNKSTVSSFLSSISTLASNLTTRTPSNSSLSPVNSTNNYNYDDTDDSDTCKSGYTKLGSWCLPWWAWIVFGGLLFLVLLTLALCCVVVCVRKKKDKKVASENYEKLSNSGAANNEYMGQQVRPSSEPPTSIYDTRAQTDYLAPSPYSAPANNAPVYI